MYNNNKQDDDASSVYDALLPASEPKFMRPVRELEKRIGFLTPLIWFNIVILFVWHAATFLGIAYVIYSGKTIKWQSLVFTYICGIFGAFGVTAGVHRLWTHRSYKAKTPFKIILLFCYSIAGQNTLLEWVRDHRVHHKFSDSKADPHDANRGFFFSHMGWLMMKKHPAVLIEGSKLDYTDITDDPYARFHIKHHGLFKLVLSFILPTIIPVVCWNETWTMAILTQPLLRHICTLHGIWSVNSFAHIWGSRPFNKTIMPAQNIWVSIVAIGEGWHNYHHTFPWDYKAAELPYMFNLTTVIIDLFAQIGWVYDLKTASPSIIEQTVKKNKE